LRANSKLQQLSVDESAVMADYLQVHALEFIIDVDDTQMMVSHDGDSPKELQAQRMSRSTRWALRVTDLWQAAQQCNALLGHNISSDCSILSASSFFVQLLKVLVVETDPHLNVHTIRPAAGLRDCCGRQTALPIQAGDRVADGSVAR
jgi:hypothetical protein